MKYCPECKSTRDVSVRLCPVCSETMPRYKVHFNTTAGMNQVYDRWLSEVIDTTDIVARLNNTFSLISESVKPA